MTCTSRCCHQNETLQAAMNALAEYKQKQRSSYQFELPITTEPRSYQFELPITTEPLVMPIDILFNFT